MAASIRTLAALFAAGALLAPGAARAGDQPITDQHLRNLLPKTLPLWCSRQLEATKILVDASAPTADQFRQVAGVYAGCAGQSQALNSYETRYYLLLAAGAAELLAARGETGPQRLQDARDAAAHTAQVDAVSCRVSGCPTTTAVREQGSGYHVRQTTYNFLQGAGSWPSQFVNDAGLIHAAALEVIANRGGS